MAVIDVEASDPLAAGGPDLAISPDTAFAIMLKARELDAKVEETDPDSGSNPSDDNSVDALEARPSDPTRHELLSAIRDLNDDEKLDLACLILVGRGDYSLAEWADARTEATDIGRDKVGHWVAGQPLASDYIGEGLAQLGLSVEDYLDSH